MFSRFQRSPSPPLFLCLDSLNILALLIGAGTGGDFFLCLDDSEPTTRAPLHWLSDSLLLPGRLHIFPPSPDAFFSPPASFTFPRSEGGVGRWEKGVCDLSLPFPICEKVHQIRPFPLGAETPQKNPDWVPWPLLSSRLSFPRVSHRRRFPYLLYRRRPSPGQLGHKVEERE